MALKKKIPKEKSKTIVLKVGFALKALHALKHLQLAFLSALYQSTLSKQLNGYSSIS